MSPFVRSIEFIFSKFFTMKAISVYGGELVGKIIDCINTKFTIIFILSTLLPVESRKKVSEFDELWTF